jgi:hypothetical protein
VHGEGAGYLMSITPMCHVDEKSVRSFNRIIAGSVEVLGRQGTVLVPRLGGRTRR